MKKCRVCKIGLNDENWVQSLKNKNSMICKTCHNENGKKWRENNRIKTNQYARKAYYKNPKKHHEVVHKHRKKIRLEMISEYGGKCVRCGIKDTDVLSIDHIDNSGSKDRKRGLYGYRLYGELKKMGWPKENFQLLCRNCNWKKEIKKRSGISDFQGNRTIRKTSKIISLLNIF